MNMHKHISQLINDFPCQHVRFWAIKEKQHSL